MNAVSHTDFEIVEGGGAEFFAPVASDVIDRLLGEYQMRRGQIEQIAAIADGDMGNALHYFMAGNFESRVSADISVSRMFCRTGAVFALNSAYWSKAMNLTDVYNAMPQARRDFWNAQLRGDKTIQVGCGHEEVPPLPNFEEDTVRPTIAGLLGARQTFFAERVDGIFRALSGTHVTNVPEGFSKRMIINRAVDEYGSSNSSRSGIIDDLRAVIAKFMGRDEPRWGASYSAIRIARKNHGQWMTLDGGALRLRVYKVGTAHLEVHPMMAYRLNQILAHLHPFAIPSEFRAKPKKQVKDFKMMGRPLPFAVLAVLAGCKQASQRHGKGHAERYSYIPNSIEISYSSDNSGARDEAERVLQLIGGVRVGGTYGHFAFDYQPGTVIDEIVTSGCIPDQRAHQFYPTPATVAEAAIELAQIGPDDTCLEPSAGMGGLADLMPKDRTLCVEISKLHCTVLEAKGHTVIEADFLKWNGATSAPDRIAMNPPFSEGRWQAHIEHAAAMLRAGGRIVAVLPASAKGKDVLPGWSLEWSRLYDGEFAGTSVSVVIMSGACPA